MNWTPDALPSLRGRHFLVTGGVMQTPELRTPLSCA